MNSGKRNMVIVFVVFILILVVVLVLCLQVRNFGNDSNATIVTTMSTSGMTSTDSFGTTSATTIPTTSGTQPTVSRPDNHETIVPTTAPATPTTPTTPTETVPVTTAPAVGTEPAPTETTVPQETKHEHSYTEKRKEPTCTADGRVTYTCACGDSYKDYIDALGHDWSEWVITKEPTTEATGDRERSCKRCGLTEKDFVAPLDKETGEEYTSYIDPRIKISHPNGARRYEHDTLSLGVIDTRTWGEDLSVHIEEDGSLRIIYFLKNGEKIELIHAPVPGKYHRGIIQEDGTFVTMLVGDFG